MKQIRKRLTYANVMSSIAVFLMIGGATAFAAGKLAKNSVGTKQLKSNSVTTAKLKKNAITTAKIKNGAVTGAKVNLGTLGTVPTATNANNANNANTVDGQTANKIFKTLTEGQVNVPVATVAGFAVTATCNTNDAEVTITAPSGQGTVLNSAGDSNGGGELTWDYDSDATGGSKIQIDNPVTTGGDYGVSSVAGATSGGITISGVLGYDYDTFDNSPPNTCIVYGHLLAG